MTVSTRNNVQVSGSGNQPMLFAHGFGCDQQMWRFITPAFADDYKIVLFDHVGAGKSDLTAYDRDKYSTLDGYADDILEICEELDLKDVIFVGHSASAMMGVLASKKNAERFSRLILVGPSPRYVDDGDYVGGFTREGIDELLDFLENNHLGWSAAMAPVIMANPDKPELSAELEDSFCATDPAIARDFARVIFLSDNRVDLPFIRTPSLIMQCSEDVIAPLSVGNYCDEYLPQSVLTIMNATGHCPQVSAPDETITTIKTYLSNQGAV